MNLYSELSSSDSSETLLSYSRARKKKRTKKKKRRKNRKDDSSEPSSSDDSDSSNDSYYRRKRRKDKKHRKKYLIRLCANLTAKLLTTAYKSKIIGFKMDEDPLQRRIYFLTFIDSLDMIFSQYRETCEVLLDYQKIGGDDVIEDYAKKAIRNLLHDNIDVHSRRLIAGFPKDGIKYIENCNHIVQTRPLLIKVYILGLSNRLHIKEGNQLSITFRGLIMHKLGQFQ